MARSHSIFSAQVRVEKWWSPKLKQLQSIPTRSLTPEQSLWKLQISINKRTGWNRHESDWKKPVGQTDSVKNCHIDSHWSLDRKASTKICQSTSLCANVWQVLVSIARWTTCTCQLDKTDTHTHRLYPSMMYASVLNSIILWDLWGLLTLLSSGCPIHEYTWPGGLPWAALQASSS